MALEEILTSTQTTEVLLFRRDLIHSVGQVSNSNVPCVSISLWKVVLPVRHRLSDTVLHSGYYNHRTNKDNEPYYNRLFSKTQEMQQMLIVHSKMMDLTKHLFARVTKQSLDR